MIKEEDLEAVKSLVNMFLTIMNDLETEPQVAMAACGRLFAQVSMDCNLGAEQFMHLCASIAKNNVWKKQEEENEKTK